MKKILIMFVILTVSLTVLISCEAITQQDINDLMTIKEVVNKEAISPSGEKARYKYEVPVINIDKPGAQKVNDTFLHLVKDMERRIGDGQNMTLFIPAKAFLNDGIISVVMEIRKGGPGGIHAINYDIKTDREVSTKELLEKYDFDPQRLIEAIDKQTKANASIADGGYQGDLVSYFIDTVITSDIYPSDDEFEQAEKLRGETKKMQEKYIMENIDKIKVYMNENGNFVFVHRGALEDEELIIE